MPQMLSGGYFGVISPEGAASILGRYKDEKHKLEQFPKDCQELATAQCIYAHQLQALGVVDEIIWEEEGADAARETYKDFPKLRSRIVSFVRSSLMTLLPLSTEQLVQQRYGKYRKLGTFSVLDEEQRVRAVESAKAASASSKKRAAEAPAKPAAAFSKLTKHLAEEVVLGERSKYRKLAPTAMNVPLTADPVAKLASASAVTAAARPAAPVKPETAKSVLDAKGAEYMCREWLPKQKRVLITDTTMRDAHQVGRAI
jgi:hypothetical protein